MTWFIRPRSVAFAWLAATSAIVAAPARAEIAHETISVATAETPQPHWFIVMDALGAYFFDADSGEMKGKVNTANQFTATIVVDAKRNAVYVPGSFYTRLYYGERSDVVVFNDLKSLAPVGEVAVPKKLAAIGHSGLAGLIGGRFLGVFNMTPATSVSIVDVETKKLVGEIATPGCAMVYPVGSSFMQICGDGTLQLVTLAADGREAKRAQSAKFFDVEKNPVYDYAVPSATGWILISVESEVFEATFANGIKVVQTGTLLTDKDKEEKWRIGGDEPFAYNAATSTLLTLMHQGEKDTHTDDGAEIWAFDHKTGHRGYRLKLPETAYAMNVSADADPRLFVLSTKLRTAYVYVAKTGKLVRTIDEAGYLPRQVQRF